ncbi:MAG TPA: hypothetical protein VLA56_04930 [Pseudomonadales bacterium]|nr:hypothetical protein [Pseudomonadales bacterium]
MLIRSLLALGACAFVVLLGVTIADVGATGLDSVTDTPWGRVTLVDFYLGVFCFVAVIWAVERSVPRTLAWGVALVVLGNPVAVAWLLTRGLARLASVGRDVAQD